MKRLPRVMIFEDGWGRGSLAASRTLAKAGHEVWVASPDRGHAGRSRSTRGWVEVPPLPDPMFLDAAAAVIEAHEVEVVIAGDDEHLLFMSPHRDKLGDAMFPHPDHASVLRALDKLSLYSAATACGLSVPEYRTEPPEEESELWISKQAMYLPGRTHDYHQGTHPPSGADGRIYQRVVQGDLLAVVSLTAPDGRPLYLGAQRAEAVSPSPFGATARGHTVAVEPMLAESVKTLLAELGWWGIAQLQFLVGSDGVPHLIDFNGRFFGSLAMTAAAGVDLPTAWLASARGEDVSLDAAALGVRYQWLEGDLRRAWRWGDRGAASWWEVLRYAPGAVHSVWSLRDPVPGARHAMDMATRAVRKVVSS